MATSSATTVKHATLTANTIDTVTLNNGHGSVEVLNRDTGGDIYFTVDGTDPAVGADNTYIAVARSGLTVPVTGAAVRGPVVKLISTTACAYTITGL